MNWAEKEATAVNARTLFFLCRASWHWGILSKDKRSSHGSRWHASFVEALLTGCSDDGGRICRLVPSQNMAPAPCFTYRDIGCFASSYLREAGVSCCCDLWACGAMWCCSLGLSNGWNYYPDRYNATNMRIILFFLLSRLLLSQLFVEFLVKEAAAAW